MEIKRIGVIGAGLMGAGIAQVAAQSGFEVNLNDVEERFIQNGHQDDSRKISSA